MSPTKTVTQWSGAVPIHTQYGGDFLAPSLAVDLEDIALVREMGMWLTKTRRGVTRLREGRKLISLARRLSAYRKRGASQP